MATPVELTLRDRLHEFFHVGDRESWACGGDLERCELKHMGAIEPMVQLISDWLDDQGLVMTAKGTVLDNTDFEELAAEAEAGYDIVDDTLIPTRPAVIGRDRRRRAAEQG